MVIWNILVIYPNPLSVSLKGRKRRNNWYIQRAHLGAAGTHVVKNYSSRCNRIFIGDPLAIVNVNCGVMAAALAKLGITSDAERGADEKGNLCTVVRQHLEKCPACQQRHNSDIYLVEQLVQECYTVRNSQVGCLKKLLPTVTLIPNKHLQTLIANPYDDTTFVELFREEHEDNFISDGTSMYMFDGTRWRALKDDDIKNILRDWCSKLFDDVMRLLKNEPGTSDAVKKIGRAKAHIRGTHGLRSVFAMAKTVFHTVDFETMDTNPLLLSANNCVVEFIPSTFTCVYRPGSREDKLTKSVGYAIPFTDNIPEADKMQEVVEIMERIYPVREELETAQLYGGYCLWGDHPDKKLELCTDAGGDWGAFAKHFLAFLSIARDVQGVNGLVTTARALSPRFCLPCWERTTASGARTPCCTKTTLRWRRSTVTMPVCWCTRVYG